MNRQVSTFAATALMMSVTVGTSILLARTLGPNGRGMVVEVLLWPTLVSGLGLLGFPIGLARTLPLTPKSDDLWWPALILSAALSIVGIAIIAGAYIATGKSQPSRDFLLVALSCLFIPGTITSTMLTKLAHAQGRLKYVNTVRVLGPLTTFVVVLALYIGSAVTITSAVVALVSGQLVVAALTVLAIPWNRARIGIGYIVPIVQRGLPFGLANALNAFTTQADRIVILASIGSLGLGLYQPATTICGAAAGFIGGSLAVLAFADSIQGAGRPSKALLTRHIRTTLALTSVVTVVLVIVLPNLLPMIYGPDFSPAVLPAQLLLLGLPFQATSLVLEEHLRGGGSWIHLASARFIPLLFLGALGYPLSQWIGLSGVAVAIALGNLLLAIFLLRSALAGDPRISYAAALPTPRDYVRLGQSVREFVLRQGASS